MAVDDPSVGLSQLGAPPFSGALRIWWTIHRPVDHPRAVDHPRVVDHPRIGGWVGKANFLEQVEYV